LLNQGMSIKDAWRYLKESGRVECMSYETFKRKVREALQ